MQKSGIEYLTHVWNFQTGCHNQENGVCTLPCWAKAMAKRFHKDFKPKLHADKIPEPIRGTREKGRRIGVCFTGDLFGDWVDPEQETIKGLDMKTDVLHMVKLCPDDQFFFLTKCPWNLSKWGMFPDNAWVGTSVCNDVMLTKAFKPMQEVNAKNKWLSIEPLLSWNMSKEDTAWTLKEMGISWLVIGGQTNPTKLPDKEWINKLCYIADLELHIPVFFKNNLKTKPDQYLRQELPR